MEKSDKNSYLAQTFNVCLNSLTSKEKLLKNDAILPIVCTIKLSYSEVIVTNGFTSLYS